MKSNKNISLCITAVLFVLAALSCAYGIYGGEVNTVNKKATNICMECIGIG